MIDMEEGFFITECPDCGRQYVKEKIGDECPCKAKEEPVK